MVNIPVNRRNTKLIAVDLYNGWITAIAHKRIMRIFMIGMFGLQR